MKIKIAAIMLCCLAAGISAKAGIYSFNIPVGGFEMSEEAKKTNNNTYAQITDVNTKDNIVNNHIRFRVMGSTGSYASDGHRYVGQLPLNIPYTIDVCSDMKFKLRGHTTDTSTSAVKISGTWIP